MTWFGYYKGSQTFPLKQSVHSNLNNGLANLIKIHYKYCSQKDTNLNNIHYKQSAHTTTNNPRTTNVS